MEGFAPAEEVSPRTRDRLICLGNWDCLKSSPARPQAARRPWRTLCTLRPSSANGAKSAKSVSPKAENAAGGLFEQSFQGPKTISVGYPFPQENRLDVPHDDTQFSIRSPCTRLNSLSLLVTNGTSKLRACAAINKSMDPMRLPFRSSSARIVPYTIAAA